MMSFFPFWLIRVLVTLLIVWLVYTCVFVPWWYETKNFWATRYWWMLPG